MEIFLSKVEMIPECGCWIWMGAEDGKGYGSGTFLKKGIRAHRLSWMLYYGLIPKGMYVCHHCDTPLCVNPHHLFLGTPTDNNHDMDRKGRRKPSGVIGEHHGAAKLTENEVKNIFNDNRTKKAIAREYGVTSTCIFYIKSKRNWKHLWKLK